jgi:Uma2 family endonuclease
MTAEEFLALPNNGTDRWLIRGELRETPITVRNRFHSRIMAQTTTILNNWLYEQRQPRGLVLCGEAGCRLRHNPETIVGIDVVYISAEVAARQTDETTLIDGVPLLVVEILSPHDTEKQTNEKVDEYLAAGVWLVWVIEAHDRTVLVYQARAEPTRFNTRQEFSGEPHLPGFHVNVDQLFE